MSVSMTFSADSHDQLVDQVVAFAGCFVDPDAGEAQIPGSTPKTTRRRSSKTAEAPAAPVTQTAPLAAPVAPIVAEAPAAPVTAPSAPVVAPTAPIAPVVAPVAVAPIDPAAQLAALGVPAVTAPAAPAVVVTDAQDLMNKVLAWVTPKGPAASDAFKALLKHFGVANIQTVPAEQWSAVVAYINDPAH